MRCFASSKCPDWLWGPSSLLFVAYWGSFLGIEQLGHEVDDSLSSGAEVKNEWIYTSAPPYAFMVWAGKLYHL